MSVRLPIVLAAITAGLAAAVCDKAAAFDVIAPRHEAGAQVETETDAAETIEPADWSALNWHPGTDATKRTRRAAPGARSGPATSWSRTDNADGSAAVAVKRSLPLAWESNVGADFIMAPQRRQALPGPVDPAALLPGGTADSSAGAAWASLSTPALAMPVGASKAAIDARIDPTHEQGKIGVSASKSLGRQLSLTLQGGYSVTDPFASGAATPLPGAPPGTPVYTTEQAAKLTILPTHTAVAAGRTMSTADARWLHTLSAEQTLFEGASIVGSVSESVEGPLTTSISAKFQRRW